MKDRKGRAAGPGHSPARVIGLATVVTLAALVTATLSGCTFAEPGYDQLLATARTDCRADAIAGVWVDRQEDPAGLGHVAYLHTLLLRGDGTGVWHRRQAGPDIALLGGNAREWRITYAPSGAGRWRIDGFAFPAGARVSGDNLLVEYTVGGSSECRVWTRASGGASVEIERERR